MRTLLVLALATACSGTAGVREHSGAVAVATHCQRHACAQPAEARHLGEGCYVVHDRLYQCSSDGPGGASCFEIPRCAEVCETTIRDERGFEISTERCESLWSAYRAAHRPPPRCAPVKLVTIAPGAAPAGSELALPVALVLDVVRSGKSRLTYEAEACATASGVVVGEASHRTGFAALDEALRGEAAKVTVPAGACTSVALVASRFECR